MRQMLHIALVLVLILTGQSMAVARTATDASGQMVLCTSTGPVTVYLDASGQPTSAPHVCPDCLQALMTALGPGGYGLPEPVSTLAKAAWPGDPAPSFDHAAYSGSARAPPV